MPGHQRDDVRVDKHRPGKLGATVHDTMPYRRRPHATHHLGAERMRLAVDDWMRRINDQGLINEPEMIQRMWPGGVQPLTAAPFILKRGSRNWQHPTRDSLQTFSGPTEVEIYVPTQGASIAYTTDTSPTARWQLYTGPFALRGPTTIRAKAIRYGYKESAETRATFAAGTAAQ